MSVLGDIAHARAGDKGDRSIIVVVADEESGFDRMRAALQPVALAAHFGVEADAVRVHPVAELRSCTVVVDGRLDGGVTRSRTADPHGKTLSGHLLELPLA